MTKPRQQRQKGEKVVKLTLDEAKELLKKEEIERQKRIKEFVDLVKKAEEKTGCSFTIDPNSSLNNIQIVAYSKK